MAAVIRDTSVSLDQNTAAATVTSPVFSTTSGQELLLAFVSADAVTTPNTVVQSVTGGGLTWVLVVRSNTQGGTSEIWRAFAPAVLKNASVSAKLSQTVASSITVESFSGVNLSGTNGAGAIGAIVSSNAATGAPSASLVTTQSNSLVVGVGNDYEQAIARTPIAGQTLLHQDLSSSGDTYWVQQVSSETAVKGSKVTLGDTAPTTDQFNLSVCEILPAVVGTTTQLNLSASSLSFGSVLDGSSKPLSLTLTSSGTAPVTISAAAISGTGFSIGTTVLPKTISPGQTLVIPVTFAPKTAGAATGKLTISSNSSAGATAAVTLTGTGTAAAPVLTVSAAQLSFGSVTDGSSKSLSLTVTSTGTLPVTIATASLTGTGFTVTSSATVPLTLAPQQSLTVNVIFSPKTAGAVAGQLSIRSNSATGATTVVALSGTGTATAAPKLTLSTTSLSFGSVTDGSTSALSLTLTSSGTSAVTVSAAAISGTGFSLGTTGLPKTLTPGQTLAIPITFAPKTAGALTGQLTISSNSTTGATTVVALSGTGTATVAPKLTLSTTSLSFGSVTDGSTSALSLTLTSSGTSAVTISAAAISGTGFSLGTTGLPKTLAPGQTLAIPITFAPKTAGALTGQLTISGNSTTGASSVVTLSGTGTTAAAPKLTLSANSLSFGSITDGNTKTLSLTVTSSGTSALTISSATLTGAGFATVVSNMPVSLPAGQSLTLQIEFAPTVAGAVTGQLTIISNSTTGSSSVVTLTGTGTAAPNPKLVLSTASLSFGNVTVGSSTTESVTLSSTGTSPVTVSAASVTGTGFSITGSSFPLTLSAGATATVTIQFLPSAAGAISGQVVFTSNSTLGATSALTLSATGVAAVAHSVDLSWSAPTSSTDPIAGYHIYRSTSATGPFTLLNSTMDVQTSYVDNTVAGSTTYTYEVRSVDDSGVESTASNEFTATIP